MSKNKTKSMKRNIKKNSIDHLNDLDYKNKYQYELLLKEYQYNINRKEQFNTKISIMMAGEMFLLSSEYLNITLNTSNKSLFNFLDLTTLILAVISILLQISIIFMTAENNIFPYFLENNQQYDKFSENNTVDYITSNISEILEERNSNYQVKTIVFNISLIVLSSSLTLYLFRQLVLILNR